MLSRKVLLGLSLIQTGLLNSDLSGVKLANTLASRIQFASSAAEAASQTELRVMILPFRNLSRLPEDEWLGDSFAESLTMGLLKVEALQLIERAQIGAVLKEQQFGQSAYVDEASAPKIGKLLGAKVVVIGSYQKVGEQLQANVRFVDVETGKIDAKRSAQIQGRFNEIFELQKQLATQLVSQLDVQAKPSELANMDSIIKATDSTEAYKAYMAGRQLLRQGDSLQLDKAKAAFKTALSFDPAYALALAGLAEVHARKARSHDLLRVPPPDLAMGVRGPDDHALARRYAEEALALNPNLPEVLRALSLIAQSEGDRAEALNLIQKSIRLNPKDSDSLMAYMSLRIEDGSAFEVDKLRSELKALGANLDDPWLQFSLGSLGAGIETSKAVPHFDWVRKLLESAMAQLPDYPYIPMSLMGIAQREGKTAEAEQLFNRAYQLGKEYPDVLASLAMVRLGQKQMNQGLELSEQAIKLNPESLHVQMSHATSLFANGRKAEAESLFKAAQTQYPDSAFVAFSQGLMYFAFERDPLKARPFFKQALDLREKQTGGMPRNTLIYYLALGDQIAKNYDAARQGYEKLLNDPIFYGLAYENLAEVLSKLNKPQAALEAYSAYLTIHPEVAESEAVKQQYRWYYLLEQHDQNTQNVAVLNDLGQLAQLRKSPDQAESYFKSALAIEPKNVVVLYNLGSLYLQTNKAAQARPLLLQAVAFKDDYAKAWYNLGLTLQALGDSAGAQTAMKKVLSLEPDHQDALKALGGV